MRCVRLKTKLKHTEETGVANSQLLHHDLYMRRYDREVANTRKLLLSKYITIKDCDKNCDTVTPYMVSL